MKVVASRLLEMITESDKEVLYSFVNQIGDRTVIISDPVIINSCGEFRNNVLICNDKIHVENLEVLAYYVANKSEEINCITGILRPDIQKYISSSSVKYKPLATSYSYRLPTIISCWDKIEI